MKALKLFAIAAACIALFASCSKTDTAKNAGGYYVSGITNSEYGGADGAAQLAWNTALAATFSGVTYKTADNDQKAIAACDKVYELHKHAITISFELYFQEAAPEGKTGAKTRVKKYDPAK